MGLIRYYYLLKSIQWTFYGMFVKLILNFIYINIMEENIINILNELKVIFDFIID